MTFLQLLIGVAAIALSLSMFLFVAWIVQQRTGNSGWVDTIWTVAVGSTGLVAALVPLTDAGVQPRQWLVAAFAAVWALRLGMHIAYRTTLISDDPRYAKMSREWGANAPRMMFRFLQIQAIVSVPLAASMFIAAHNPAPIMRAQDWIAVAIVVIAVLGEGLADWQMQQFRANSANKGGVIDTGLWSLSRHPNYFFETLGWLAYPLLAIDLFGAYHWGWLAFSGLAVMYWLLVYVSGIPLLEQHMLETRGEKFRAYQQRTNAYFPGPPK